MKNQTRHFLLTLFFCISFFLLGSSPLQAARCPRCHRQVRNAYQCPYCDNNYSNYYNDSYNYDEYNSNTSYNNRDFNKEAGKYYVVSRATKNKSKNGALAILAIIAVYLFQDHPILGSILGGLVILGFIGNYCDKRSGK